MAKTKAGKKKVYVREHKRGDTTVKKHYRSTPNQRVQQSESESPSLFGWFTNLFK